MSRLFSIILFFFFVVNLPAQSSLDNEIEKIVNQLINQMSGTTVKNVAVADFTNLDGTPTELGKYLAEEFSFTLANAKKNFTVIDRSRVNALMKEAGLGAQGLLDPNSSAKLGKLKGIDAVIVGTTTESGNYIRVIVKVLQLETAGTLAAAKGDISKTPTIIQLSSKELGSNGTNSTTTDSQTSTSKTLPKPTLSPIATQKKDNLTFELVECKQTGQIIRCVCQVTSEDIDSELSVYGRDYTRIFDAETGKEFYPTNIDIGGKKGGAPSDGTKKTVIAGYPVKIIIEFGGITIPIKTISKLEMTINQAHRGTGSDEINLRNIPVSK